MAAPAWAVDLWTNVKPYVEKLAVWRGYEQELWTLTIIGVGIAVFTILVFAFYRSLSRLRPMRLRLSEKPGWKGRLARTGERTLAFPVVSFLFFVTLAGSLFFLTKPEISTGTILTIAMGVVVGVRVTVYFSEEMSNDLAKLVPLSLLAVVLVDPGYLKLRDAWVRFAESTHMGPLLLRYFLLFIALEVVMGLGRAAVLRLAAASRNVRSKVNLTTPGEKRAMKAEETTFTLEVQETKAEPPKSAQ